MRKFYQSVLLTGIAVVAISASALATTSAPAKETSLNKAYDKVVAASTAIQAKKEGDAVSALRGAKWNLRKNDLLNKDKDEVAKDKEIITNIDGVLGTLKGKDTAKFEKASSDVQKVQDAVQAQMNAHPAPAEAPKTNK